MCVCVLFFSEEGGGQNETVENTALRLLSLSRTPSQTKLFWFFSFTVLDTSSTSLSFFLSLQLLRLSWCAQFQTKQHDSVAALETPCPVSTSATRCLFALGSNLWKSCLIIPRLTACVCRISASAFFCALSSLATSSCKPFSPFLILYADAVSLLVTPISPLQSQGLSPEILREVP